MPSPLLSLHDSSIGPPEKGTLKGKQKIPQHAEQLFLLRGATRTCFIFVCVMTFIDRTGLLGPVLLEMGRWTWRDTCV